MNNNERKHFNDELRRLLVGIPMIFGAVLIILIGSSMSAVEGTVSISLGVFILFIGIMNILSMNGGDSDE